MFFLKFYLKIYLPYFLTLKLDLIKADLPTIFVASGCLGIEGRVGGPRVADVELLFHLVALPRETLLLLGQALVATMSEQRLVRVGQLGQPCTVIPHTAWQHSVLVLWSRILIIYPWDIHILWKTIKAWFNETNFLRNNQAFPSKAPASHSWLETSLTWVLWKYHTYGNIIGIKQKITKYLRESFGYGSITLSNVFRKMFKSQRYDQNIEDIFERYSMNGLAYSNPKHTYGQTLIEISGHHLRNFPSQIFFKYSCSELSNNVCYPDAGESTLPRLRLLWGPMHKDAVLWKPFKPSHVGIHWIALAECSQMSTHEPGFDHFSQFLHHLVMAKLATSSIWVKNGCYPLSTIIQL